MQSGVFIYDYNNKIKMYNYKLNQPVYIAGKNYQKENSL